MARKRISDMVQQEVNKNSTVEVEIVPEENQAVTSDAEAKPDSATVQAELEAKIAELTTKLEESHVNERALQEKLFELQGQLEEKTQFIERLKTEIKEADLKGKLEKAQEAAFQLSEINTKLIEELKHLRQENETLKAEIQSAQKQPEPPQPQPLATPKPQPQPQPQFKSALVRRPYSSSSQPNSTEDFSNNTWLL